MQATLWLGTCGSSAVRSVKSWARRPPTTVSSGRASICCGHDTSVPCLSLQLQLQSGRHNLIRFGDENDARGR